MMRVTNILVFVCIAILMAGCKLAVIVPEGGFVRMTEGVVEPGVSTFLDCDPGSVCILDVNDTNFSWDFTAIPESGWYFVKWYSGDRFFCTNSYSRGCKLSLEETAGNAAIEELVASTATFYIMPIFQPIPETITIEGKDWYQPNLFINLSWNDINIVCPAGRCSGFLNGYDLTGWTWASADEVSSLFSNYFGFDLLVPDKDIFIGGGDDFPYPPNDGFARCTQTTEFWADGWQIMDGTELSGWVREQRDNSTAYFKRFINYGSYCIPEEYIWYWTLGDWVESKATRGEIIGAWFYRER